MNYVRVQGEGRAYYPITDKITLVGRAVAGTIQGWGGDDVRLLDLYFRGGETVRGFDRAGYGPRDLADRSTLLAVRTSGPATAEVRFPLPFIPEDLGISGAAFVDAGSLWGAPGDITDLYADNNVELFDDSQCRSAVGVSLLWNSPVGPLRVDYVEADHQGSL